MELADELHLDIAPEMLKDLSDDYKHQILAKHNKFVLQW